MRYKPGLAARLVEAWARRAGSLPGWVNILVLKALKALGILTTEDWVRIPHHRRRE